jgi:alpha-beta hydrolase superfamily lysophospholipase
LTNAGGSADNEENYHRGDHRFVMLLNSLRFARRRGIRHGALALAILVCCWLLISWYVVYHLTRRARAPFAEPAPEVSWGTLEAMRLKAADGEEIGAWYVPGSAQGPSVLLLHGNGDSRRTSLPVAEFFARQGCSLLLVSLRAHGDSTGEVNDIGYSARHDVVSAVAYLERRRPGRPIVVQGTSLGAAAAVYAAQTLGTRVRGYVLESPYADIYTAVLNRMENHLPFPLDRVGYAGMVVTGPLVLPNLEQMAPVKAIDAVPSSVPVVLLAGGRDRDARPEEAQAMYERVRSHGRLVWFAQAKHESYYRHDPTLYREAVGPLLAETQMPELALRVRHATLVGMPGR